MGRLIDEQTAYDVLTDYYHHSTDTQHAALREALGRVETVDAVPVRHGRWMLGVSLWYCSECGSSYSYGDYAFCPNCGADMRGDHEKAD